MKVNIVYWSGTGNTKTMAALIAEGAQGAGAEASLIEVADAKLSDITDADVVALGCPAMGNEDLEEFEVEPFITDIEGSVSGKKLALFGSYGWGGGEFMENWSERMKNAGASLVADGLTVEEMPRGGDEQKCRDFGAALVK